MPKMPQLYIIEGNKIATIVKRDRKDKGRVLVEYPNGERLWTLQSVLTPFSLPRELVLRKRRKK